MKTIAILRSMTEARQLQSRLEERGILTCIPLEGGSGAAHLFGNHPEFVLQVDEVDEEKAIQVINLAFAVAN